MPNPSDITENPKALYNVSVNSIQQSNPCNTSQININCEPTQNINTKIQNFDSSLQIINQDRNYVSNTADINEPIDQSYKKQKTGGKEPSVCNAPLSDSMNDNMMMPQQKNESIDET